MDCNTVAVGLLNGWLLFAGAPADSNKGHVYICVVRQLFLSVTGEIKVTIQRRTLHFAAKSVRKCEIKCGGEKIDGL